MVQLWYNFRLLRFNLSFIYIETMEHPLVKYTCRLFLGEELYNYLCFRSNPNLYNDLHHVVMIILLQ